MDCSEQLTEVMVKSDTLYQGKILNLRVDLVRLPSGRTSTREVVSILEA